MLHILAHTEAQEPASATTDQMGSSSSVPFSTSTAPTGALLFPLCFTNHAKVMAIHGDNLKELDAPSSTDLYFRAEQALPKTVQIKFSFFFFFPHSSVFFPITGCGGDCSGASTKRLTQTESPGSKVSSLRKGGPALAVL